MKKFYFFLFIVFFVRTNSHIKENPIFLVESENLIVLSTNDDYYYVITSNKSFKIKKDSGDIETIYNNIFNVFDYNYFSDNEYNNYLYKHINNKYSLLTYTLNFDYYKIIYNSSISYNEINIGKKACLYNMKSVGGIAKENELFIYGYSSENLIFIKKSDNNCVCSLRNNINEKLSCKLIEDESFICAMIINYKLQVFCFKYRNSVEFVALTSYINVNSLTYDSISSFGLYDTDNNYIKLLCRQRSQTIYCEFVKIILSSQPSFQSNFNSLGDEKLIFTAPNNFEEKNCYLSKFNSEYLLCCAITNYIQCYRINCNNYIEIKKFSLSINGDNSYLIIKSSFDYSTFFFINYYNDKFSAYEYYIYVPTCQNRNYIIPLNIFFEEKMIINILSPSLMNVQNIS